MALPDVKEPGTLERISDPAYLAFAWARYLRQEAEHARGKHRRTIVLSAEGAEEVARLLDSKTPKGCP